MAMSTKATTTDQDIDEAKKFLKIIAPHGGGTFQTFDDNKERKATRLCRILHGTTEANFTTLARLNKEGAGIFVMVNQGNNKGRKTENITRVRAVFVDLDKDGKQKLDHILSIKALSPRLVVESSPEKFHVYWLVDGELPLEYFTYAQKHFASLFGGDPAICDLPRVMRLPGFLHNKKTPFTTRTILDNPDAKPLQVSLLEKIKTKISSNQSPDPQTTTPVHNAEFEVRDTQELPLWLPETLEHIDAHPYDKWLKVGMALHNATHGESTGLQVFIEWSSKAENFSDQACRDKWASFGGDYPGQKLTLGTIHHMATEAGWAGEAKGAQTETDDGVILHLASLSPLDYDRERAKAAEAMGVRVSILDKLVQEAKGEQAPSSGLIFDEILPWDEPVDSDTLLTSIVDTILRFIVCQPETAQAVALWVAMTWLMDVVQVAPLAIITAPEKRCGKSQLLFLLGKLVYRPLTASHISTAALFRTIDAWKPTMLVDEADSFMKENEDMRGLLNSGHTRDGAYIIRVVGDDHEPKKFNTWGAKALAGIGKLSDTLMDRAIVLELRRKLPHEQVDRLRYAEANLFQEISRKLCRFAMDSREEVREARPKLPEVINDRAQDNWEPLLAIADVAGGQWPTLARAAAVKLSCQSDPVTTVGIQLLSDIREIFEVKNVDRIRSPQLISFLCEDEENAWATYNRGKSITPRQVARRLSDYGITSNTIRIGSSTAKGYMLDWFTEAFSRYLDAPLCQCVTPSQPPFIGQPDVTECSL